MFHKNLASSVTDYEICKSVLGCFFYQIRIWRDTTAYLAASCFSFFFFFFLDDLNVFTELVVYVGAHTLTSFAK